MPPSRPPLLLDAGVRRPLWGGDLQRRPVDLGFEREIQWPRRCSLLHSYVGSTNAQQGHYNKFLFMEDIPICIRFSVNTGVQSQPSTGFAPIVEPPEYSIAMLVSMGFDGNDARQALMRARNDINVATNILLEA
ncbi:hypothetical protein BS78_10G127900 [Paspalum vaginatum]|nr:hypothetical protein BS78_10G127900 [Paspalum vaginatum]